MEKHFFQNALPFLVCFYNVREFAMTVEIVRLSNELKAFIGSRSCNFYRLLSQPARFSHASFDELCMKQEEQLRASLSLTPVMYSIMKIFL